MGTEAEHTNSCAKYFFACVSACLDCFERFIRYLNKQAYVQVANACKLFDKIIILDCNDGRLIL